MSHAIPSPAHRAESSLEYGTKLVGRSEGRWRFVLYPDAAEGGGAFRSTTDDTSGGDSPGPDPERKAADAARRARAKVRRYSAANRLNRLGTLTYAGSGNHDPGGLRSDLAEFFRRLRTAVGEPFPYLWAPEWHRSCQANAGIRTRLSAKRSVPPQANVRSRPTVRAGSRLSRTPRAHRRAPRRQIGRAHV